MKILFLLIMLLSTLSFGKTALQYAREIEEMVDGETVDFPYLKAYADEAVNGALSRAYLELRKRGNYQLADSIEHEWNSVYGASFFSDTHNIGDHAPISKWLADKYNLIEAFLGLEVCKATHISDIKTLNSGIITVIHPGNFPMDSVAGDRKTEYVRHFAGGPSGDDTYYGVIPVIIYWSVNIGLTAAGAPIVSSLIASVAERLMDIAAVELGSRIFIKFN